jgi:hypothetical protein
VCELVYLLLQKAAASRCSSVIFGEKCPLQTNFWIHFSINFNEMWIGLFVQRSFS